MRAKEMHSVCSALKKQPQTEKLTEGMPSIITLLTYHQVVTDNFLEMEQCRFRNEEMPAMTEP